MKLLFIWYDYPHWLL